MLHNSSNGFTNLFVGFRRRRSFSAIIFVKEIFIIHALVVNGHDPTRQMVLDMLQFRCAAFATWASLRVGRCRIGWAAARRKEPHNMKRKPAVLALAVGFLTAASVQAVPTTYEYTGNPFTFADAPYTTSDFVTALVTLAAPLAPNMPLTPVTPTAFTLSDGVMTITNLSPSGADPSVFEFQTNGTGEITMWRVMGTKERPGLPEDFILTANSGINVHDTGVMSVLAFAENFDAPGTWARASVPDAASTFTLLSLSLTALGVAAHRYKRVAA
jgi:hypothetical protein